MSATSPLTGSKRLDSWKEIAAFFGRDERTVNRWEKDLGLPVHRLPGTKGRVYAFTEELSAWLAASNNSANNGDNAAVQPEPIHRSAGHPKGESSRFTLITGRNSGEAAPSEPSPTQVVRPAAAQPHRQSLQLLTAALLTAALLVAATAALIILWPNQLRPNQSRNSTVTTPTASQTHQTSPGSVALASSPSHDPQAEQLYLKGRYYWNKRTPDDLNKALDYFMQAVVHDPNYSQAYVGLADSYNLMREYTLMPASDAYPRALAAAKKAVELDDQSSEAHASLAFASFFGMWDIATGEHEFRRAIDLNPNNAVSHHWYANALITLHRFPEALVEIERAQALDPASAAILADKGNILSLMGRNQEALTLLKQMEAREPAFLSPHRYLTALYFRTQDYPDYISELRKDAVLVHDNSALAIAAAAEKGFHEGGRQGMFKAMLLVQKSLYLQRALAPTDLAKTFAMLGDKADALRYLKIAYEQRDNSLIFIELYPEFDILHAEPEYRDLMARMNLPVPSA